ncbi:hypothetical protein EZV62_018309 [Acer yangbiense]|uniref:Cyclin N-terminal domain-containing protein n=1 Tax=Acer yangbiense TaxID=1000413 RepID=A0A5C7HL73_9ROSI|nr:hypothetical protein EZV62_018309 [Acer yangbiense]
MGYYLADGIYPPWSTLVQTIHDPRGPKNKLFAMKQEGCRKDVERVFGVLQSRFASVAGPARFWHKHVLHDIMTACIIMHNMIIEDDRDVGAAIQDHTEAPIPEVEMVLDENTRFREFLARHRQIMNKDAHSQVSCPLANFLDSLGVFKIENSRKKERERKREREMWRGLAEFLIQSASELHVSPIVKYTAFSLFADRFYSSLTRYIQGGHDKGNWLLKPTRESNLQLFALISLWISSKIHDSRPLSVKSLKCLGDKIIKEQHFTTRDFSGAEIVFMQVLDFNIGTSNIAFIFLEELLVQFKEVARVGEFVSFEACMDLMDLLYEKEETTILYRSPRSLAASVLACFLMLLILFSKSCIVFVPLLNFVTSIKEDDVVESVGEILKHVFEPR